MDELPQLKVIFDSAINYAFQQNAIPVVKEIWFRNGEQPRQNIVIRFKTEPSFAEPMEIRLQSLAAGEEFRAPSVDLKLGHDFLANLPERVAGWLRIEIAEGEEVFFTHAEEIALLSKNEWCGLTSLPEILAAFVLPNDPTVMTILGRASEILRENTGRGAFNAYQDKSRKRAWEQAAAIYRALAEMGIRYITVPASFETTGQKVRFPSEIVTQRFANCLDMSLLFAACCEQAGLHPLILIHEGHAYSGLWLEEHGLAEPASDDLQYIRKLHDNQQIVVLEATLLTHENPGTLDQAEKLAINHLNTTTPFRLALDVHCSRLERIRPIPIPGQHVAENRGNQSIIEPEQGLGNREIREAFTPQSSESRPVSRIDLWKSRLLDLSLRNRLLNFKEMKATIRIMSAAPEHVEDELAAECELALLPKPKFLSDGDPRDSETMSRQQREDIVAQHLKDELNRKRLHTTLDEKEHGRRLTELFRSARNALDENGTNTLFAAVGLLEWKQTEHSDRILRAPILLVPIELKRKSVLEGFSIRRIDEETRLNVTLLEMLRQDFRLEIPGLDPLPEDDHGVDVGLVFQIFRDAVRELQGWEVKAEIWLGQFSFTKFLLWKDLADRVEDLSQNRIVKHLVEEAGSQYDNPKEDIKPEGLDQRFHPKDVFCPRSADSSQLAAIMAAAEGHDFVLEGPPGTGKSQTITNIIAQCIASGKRVLFVAEKRAALDVVHRRLKEDGLEPFCLQLHSNKTGKMEVLAQFDQVLRFATEGNAKDWERQSAELQTVRQSLNDYTEALHTTYPCGLSAYQCYDYMLPRRDAKTVRLDAWPSIEKTTWEELSKAREWCKTLQEKAHAIHPVSQHPLNAIGFEDWNPGWAEEAFESITLTNKLAHESRDSVEDLLGYLKWKTPHVSRKDLGSLRALAECLTKAEPVGQGFLSTPWQQVSSTLDHWISLSQERNKLREELTTVQGTKGNRDGTSAAEDWSADHLETFVRQGTALEVKAAEAGEAAEKIRKWLRANRKTARREELSPLIDFAEILLQAPELGSEFAKVDWNIWITDLNRWIILCQEREELRDQLLDYDLGKLLSMNPSSLMNAWSSAKTSWFLIRKLRTSSIRKSLKGCHRHGVVPDAEMTDRALSLGQQLQAIEMALLEANNHAKSMLGTVWKNGQASSEDLLLVRKWMSDFDAVLKNLCREDTPWEASVREVLCSAIQSPTSGFAPQSQNGLMLSKAVTTIRDLMSDCDRTISEGAINDEVLNESMDYCGALLNALQTVRLRGGRLAEISKEFSQHAITVQECLGELWESGAPDAKTLIRAKKWGAEVHSQIVAFAGEDLDSLLSLRQFLGRLFAEGSAAVGPASALDERLKKFLECQKRFVKSYDQLSNTLRLESEAFDTATNFPEFVGTNTKTWMTSWNRIREWCSWLKAKKEASESGLLPILSILESPEGETEDLSELFERSFRKGLLFSAIESKPILRDFFGNEHEQKIAKFRDLDEHVQELARDLIALRLSTGIPQDGVANDIPKQELALLRKEVGEKEAPYPSAKAH